MKAEHKNRSVMTHPVMPWLVEHAGCILSRCQKGRDGKTPFERLHGKKPTQDFVPFGEKVLARRVTTEPMNRMNPRYQYGIWLGMRNNSAECFVGNAEGVFRAREIRRLEPRDRWDREAINSIIGVPWRMTDGRWTVDRPEIQVDPIPMPPLPFDGARVQRERITKQDIDEFGATIGCPGCNAIRDNKRAQARTERCRRRIEESLRKTPQGAERLERREEVINEALAEEVRRSSAEAELYAAALGASELKGIISLMRDLGYEKKPVLAIDAKATEHILHRQGIGKLKHIDVAYLWIQDEVRSHRLQVRRVKSEDNIADLGTKPLSKAVIAKHCTTMGYMNMSQENAQTGHQSWGASKHWTNAQQVTMSRKQAEANRSNGSVRSSGSKQAKSLDPSQKSGSRSQNMTRTRGAGWGNELEDYLTKELKNDCKENAEDSNQGTGSTTSSRLRHRPTRSPTWRPTTSPSSGRHGERTPR